jgi:hypothetical protein
MYSRREQYIANLAHVREQAQKHSREQAKAWRASQPISSATASRKLQAPLAVSDSILDRKARLPMSAKETLTYIAQRFDKIHSGAYKPDYAKHQLEDLLAKIINLPTMEMHGQQLTLCKQVIDETVRIYAKSDPVSIMTAYRELAPALANNLALAAHCRSKSFIHKDIYRDFTTDPVPAAPTNINVDIYEDFTVDSTPGNPVAGAQASAGLDQLADSEVTTILHTVVSAELNTPPVVDSPLSVDTSMTTRSDTEALEIRSDTDSPLSVASQGWQEDLSAALIPYQANPFLTAASMPDIRDTAEPTASAEALNLAIVPYVPRTATVFAPLTLENVPAPLLLEDAPRSATLFAPGTIANMVAVTSVTQLLNGTALAIAGEMILQSTGPLGLAAAAAAATLYSWWNSKPAQQQEPIAPSI